MPDNSGEIFRCSEARHRALVILVSTPWGSRCIFMKFLLQKPFHEFYYVFAVKHLPPSHSASSPSSARSCSSSARYSLRQSNTSCAQGCRQLGKLDLKVMKDSRLHCPVRAHADRTDRTDCGVPKHGASWSCVERTAADPGQPDQNCALGVPGSASLERKLAIVVFS